MRIHNKLFLILILFSALLVSTIAALAQWSIDKGMIEYVNTREATALQPFVVELASLYQQSQSWKSFALDPRSFHIKIKNSLSKGSKDYVEGKGSFSRPPLHPPQHQSSRQSLDERPPEQGRNKTPRRPPPRGNFPPDGRDSKINYVLLDAQKSEVAGDLVPHKSYSYIPIEINATAVGYLAIAKREELTEGYELDFIQSQHNFLWIIALGVMLLVILVTLPLARHLVTPLRTLNSGMHQLTQGNYQQKMDFKRKDELGDLGRDFNELASTLEKNDTARKRWLANISHELRTPLAILRGELEAMIDKVRPLSIENVTSANDEVQHLARLIDDLQVLTSTDIGGMTYRKEEVNLVSFIQHESKKYQDYLSESALSYSFNTSTSDVYVYADQTRLCQLIENLLNNSIKYARSGTQVRLSLHIDNEFPERVQLIIEDDGKGVNKQHLPYLFEHLYRVDDSRNRSTGGTGLGLSICAHIVEAHQGEISAEQSVLGGLAVTISLPISQ